LARYFICAFPGPASDCNFFRNVKWGFGPMGFSFVETTGEADRGGSPQIFSTPRVGSLSAYSNSMAQFRKRPALHVAGTLDTGTAVGFSFAVAHFGHPCDQHQVDLCDFSYDSTITTVGLQSKSTCRVKARASIRRATPRHKTVGTKGARSSRFMNLLIQRARKTSLVRKPTRSIVP